MKNSTGGATEAAFQTMTESAKFQIDKIKANIEGIETQLCNSIHACNERYSHVNSGDDRRTEGAVEQFSSLVRWLVV